MHLIGTSILSYGVTPANDTIPFIDIPNWDFHWQGNYDFPRVLKIPAGSTLYSEAHYDNTTANHHNPNNPPQLVTLGESTTDEMMLVYFAFTPYYPGDENILIDSTTTSITPVFNSKIITPQLYDPVPNPSNGNISYQYFLPENSSSQISVTDIQGKIVYEESSGVKIQGLVTSNLHIENLSAGIYFLTLKADGLVRTKKLVKK